MANKKTKPVFIDQSATVRISSDSKSIMETAYDYWELSSLLFSGLSSCPYDINQIEPSSKFYFFSKSLAETLGVDWNTMSHEDSNRIMLGVLEHCFQQIKQGNETAYLTISVSDKPFV